MNKDLLISFLNALFNGKKQEIIDVQYLNAENLGEAYGDRRAVFDVYCMTNDGSRFIVEMQKAEQEYFNLEVPKFTKTEDELETMFDKWMFVLHNLGRLLDRPKALQDRVFQKLFEQAEIARYSESERWKYFESQKEYWDNYSIMTTALNKGLAQGRAEGRAEGLAEGILKTARNLKQRGFSASDISKATGLNPQEIENL